MKKKIKTALISVSDKTNLKPLLNILKKNKIKIISSGGTYKEIKRLKFNCLEVSDFTNSPEILEGRIKTLHPNSKVMKTQDNKSILIELDDEGWKFSCDNFEINIDNGLYFGNKNSYKENQNIFISGMNNEKEQVIKWEISKL